MNSIKIAAKLVQQNMKTVEYWIVLLLFPLLIILILGYALGGSSDAGPEIDLKAGVFTETDGYLSSGIKNIEMPGLSLISFSDRDKAETAYSEDEIDALVFIDEAEKDITLLSESDFDRVILETVIDGVITGITLHMYYPEAAISDSRTEFSRIESFGDAKGLRAIDYYAVTMLTMFILYGAYFSAYGVIDEKKNGTLRRILAAPVRASSFLGGVTLGTLITSSLQAMIITFCAQKIFGVNYGSNFPVFILLILVLIVFTISLGVWISSIVKNTKLVDTGVNIFVMLVVFLGGGFMSLPDSGFIAIASKISPVFWINRGIFSMIYGGDLSEVIPAMAIIVFISVLMLTHGSIVFLKKEAV